jgi:hypothetical protein
MPQNRRCRRRMEVGVQRVSQVRPLVGVHPRQAIPLLRHHEGRHAVRRWRSRHRSQQPLSPRTQPNGSSRSQALRGSAASEPRSSGRRRTACSLAGPTWSWRTFRCLREQYALELIGDRPEGVGYLLKERVGDVEAVARVAPRRRVESVTGIFPKLGLGPTPSDHRRVLADGEALECGAREGEPAGCDGAAYLMRSGVPTGVSA